MGRGLNLPAVAAVILSVGMPLGCSSGRPQETSSVPAGWPVPAGEATVTSTFGSPRGRSTHHGLDLAAPRGTRVSATADGVVTFAARSGDYGRMVVIDHGGGWETRYAHLHRIRVEQGDRVHRGNAVGSVGHSGNANGNHVHYEIRYRGVAVDPGPTLGR